MNKLSLLVGFALSSCTYGLAQSPEIEPRNVIVDWKVGTEKTVYRVDSTVIYSNDSLFLATGVNSNYRIKVASLVDTTYEILFKQMNIDANIQVESEVIATDPMEKMMQDLIKELQEKMLGFEYSFLVSKNTALAFEVKNQDAMMKMIEELVVVVLSKYMDESKVELDASEKAEVQLKVKEYMNEQMPAAMRTMLNSFNYIFQAYSFPFILNETYTVESEVSNLDQVQYGDKKNKVKFIINSSVNGSKLTIDYLYQYDKESAYQDYIVSQGKGDEIPISEFDVQERVQSDFDVESSWITGSTSFAAVKMGVVRVYQTTYLNIK